MVWYDLCFREIALGTPWGEHSEKGQEWKQGTQVESRYFNMPGKSCGGLDKSESSGDGEKTDWRDVFKLFGMHLGPGEQLWSPKAVFQKRHWLSIYS